MDAKAKANFINSVGEKKEVPCPKCSSLNEANAKFCIFCGASLIKKDSSDESKEKQDNIPSVIEEESEAEGVFAEGLPAWDVEPPQTVVRRKKKI